MRKQKRSKSVNTLKTVQNATFINRRYADLLDPMLQLKYSKQQYVGVNNQHKPYMQLLEVLKKFNSVLKKEQASYDNQELHYLCESIYQFTNAHADKLQPNNVQYFISKLQQKQNSAKYYEQKLLEEGSSAKEQQYAEQVKDKTRQMRKMLREQEREKIYNKNKLEKILYEYNKQQKEIQKMNKTIISYEIKLREIEKNR